MPTLFEHSDGSGIFCFVTTFVVVTGQEVLNAIITIEADFNIRSGNPNVDSVARNLQSTSSGNFLVITRYGATCDIVAEVETIEFGACFQSVSNSLMYQLNSTVSTWQLNYYTGSTACAGVPTVTQQNAPCSKRCGNSLVSTYCTMFVPVPASPASLVQYYPTLSLCQSSCQNVKSFLPQNSPQLQVFVYPTCAYNGTFSSITTCALYAGGAGVTTTVTYRGSTCAGDAISTTTTPFTECANDSGYGYGAIVCRGACNVVAATIASTASPTAAESSSCFAGSELVNLESGDTVSIANVIVGDRVLAADMSGKTVFSEVVLVPHGRNNDRRVFTQLRTNKGRDIRLTGNHMVLAGSCDFAHDMALVNAASLQVGSCVQSITGREEVVASEQVEGHGIYTIVTKSSLVVVNGIVASPFAGNHAAANAYYNIHRAIYEVAPWLLRMQWLLNANVAFGAIVDFFSA